VSGLCVAQEKEMWLRAVGSVEFKSGGTGEAGCKEIREEDGPISKLMLLVEGKAQEGNAG
jgi:hypothetical protein